jgi:hypothetical protein
MALWPFNLLTDTNEHPAINDISSDTLAKMAETPASELFVQRMHDSCWVKRWVRQFRLSLAMLMGFLVALQLGSFFFLRIAIRESVRAGVIEILLEKKLISSEPTMNPHLAITLTQGGAP